MVKKLSIGFFILAFLVCTGCTGKYSYREESQLDKNWGKSFEFAKENQKLNPEAGQNLEPITGMDGKSAEVVVNRYHGSFQKTPATPEYRLNLGPMSTTSQDR